MAKAGEDFHSAEPSLTIGEVLGLPPMTSILAKEEAMKLFRHLIGVAVLLVVPVAAQAQKVHVGYEKGTDFS